MKARTLTHGERAYLAGCRCDVCRAWRTHANGISRARRAKGLDKTTNPNHGTERRAAAGCQCALCADAAERRRVRVKATNAAYYAGLTDEQKRATRHHSKRWRKANRDTIREYRRRWAAANAEKVKAYAAKWRATHRHPAHSPLWPFLPANTSRDQMIETITAAVPNIPQAIRADVCQDLAIVWLTTGTITRDNVRAAVTANWKLCPVLAGRDISLSTPAYRDGDGRDTLADRLTA